MLLYESYQKGLNWPLKEEPKIKIKEFYSKIPKRAIENRDK